jgi:4-hydroxybutyryl-CoA dehydratase / vinylacetyl-CoA-Delta-isomerase
VLTKEAYLQTIRGINHRVFIQGEVVENIVDHPISRPPAMALAETYAQAEKDENKALYTAISHLTGEPVNRFLHIQHTIGDLIAKIDMLRDMGRKTACCFQRCAGLDCVNAVYSVTYDIDRACGTPYHERFKKFLIQLQQNDFFPAACMTDAKGDRGLSPSQQADKDQFLHIVAEKPDGVVVRGAKLHITGGVNAHELIVMPTRALTEADKEYAIAFAVPADTPGVTMIYGRQPSDSRRLEVSRADIGNLHYGGCEALVVFDDVFVPNERIFMKGEFPFAGKLVELFASNHRASYGGCKVGVGDALIGATSLIAEVQGTDKASHVKDKIAEMVHLNETLNAGALASAVRGHQNPCGSYSVNPLAANSCKLNITRFPFEISRLAQDIAGGLMVTLPSIEDLRHEEIGPYVRKYFTGKAGVDSETRMRLLRLIENITLGTGAVSYLTESIHGAGSPQAQKIMITRLADMESSKAAAKRLCGI